jgi:hypothetical protein
MEREVVMRRVEVEHAGRFVAVDGEGREVPFNVFQKYNVSVDLDGVRHRTPTIQLLETEDGTHLNCVTKGEYQVWDTGEILRCPHADAP